MSLIFIKVIDERGRPHKEKLKMLKGYCDSIDKLEGQILNNL